MLGLISQHALIDARMAFDERRGKALAAESGVETDYGVLVRELADPEVYPHLTRIVGQEPPRASRPTTRATEYAFDIGIILDGLEALAARSAR